MKSIPRKLKRCGIYMITNLVNSKKYIGSSINIQQRLMTHRSNLRHNSHVNKHLQNAWNKYGEDNFDYSILEFCPIEDRFIREQYYVDLLSPEYNISIEVVELPGTSEESRKKLSQTRKERIASGLIPKTHCTKVYVYDLFGRFIKEFESEADAIRELNITRNGMSKVLSKEQTHTHGFRIFKTPQNNLLPYKRKRDHKSFKAVIVYNNYESFEFESAEKCAKHFNVHLVYIRDAIKNNRNFKRKYMIKYKDASL